MNVFLLYVKSMHNVYMDILQDPVQVFEPTPHQTRNAVQIAAILDEVWGESNHRLGWFHMHAVKRTFLHFCRTYFHPKNS